MNDYEPHPAAELFPMMLGDQYEAFKEDIRKNGFQQDVTIYKGQILDGRNRYKAAIELDMLDELPICEIDDDTDFNPYQWVISRNLHRRHLNESQRSIVGAKYARLKHGDNQHTMNEDGPIGLSTIQEAANAVQVGTTTIKRAKTVLANGSQELIEAVEQGKVAVSKAAVVAKEVPKECQLNYIIHEQKEKDKQDKFPVDIDQQAVEDFLRCRSPLNRLKKLVDELTDQQRLMLKEWLLK